MLYHYTAFIALDGIIRCAELRLNNILNMNDAAEMRLFINGICRAVTEKLAKDGEAKKIRLTEEFFQKEMVKEFQYSAYAACFSKYRDDAAQWERYGHSGKGVCIAMHADMIQQMTGGTVTLQEVYYQNDMHDHHLVDEFYHAIKETASFSDDLSKLHSLMHDAWIQSAAFKHPSFASEKEFRLMVSPFILNELAIGPRYHVAAGRIKKYYPLDLNRMCDKLNLHLSDLIGEIIIGPMSSQSVPILQDYLVDHGLGVIKDKISLSECPLRKPTL